MGKEDNKQVRKVAVLVACASALQVLESLFPHPLPGIRLGLPNVITLVCLIDIGFAASVEVAVLRTVVSSFFLGTFMSPTFVLSFAGALSSAVVMGLAYKLTLKVKHVFLSITGISLLGAITHNLAQIVFVYFLLIKQKEIFLLLPWLGISAVVMGWFNGLVASGACKKLQSGEEETLEKECAAADDPFKPAVYAVNNSPVNSLYPEIKIIFVIIMAVLILLFSNIYFYLGVLVAFFALAYFSGISLLRLAADMRKMFFFILTSFLVPVLFNTGGELLFRAWILKITSAGVHTGAMFAFRIILFSLSSSFLVKTTPPEKMIQGLKRVFFPLRIVGISAERTASIIMQAWDCLPSVWGRINNLIRAQKYEFIILPKLVSALSGIITVIYREADNN